MAQQKARDLWKQLKDEDRENRYCIECNSANPQWASVSYGTFFCLECSGVHRSLGVHLSFVRSLTMDSWSDRQLAMMQAGGNTRAKNFFKQHGVDGMGIKEKYATKAATQLREMIAAQVDGRTYEDDKKKASPQGRPSSTTPKQDRPPNPKLARDELDDWLDEKPKKQASRTSQVAKREDSNDWGRNSPSERSSERPKANEAARNTHARSSSNDSYSSRRSGSDYDTPPSSRASYSSSNNYSSGGGGSGYNGNNSERLNQFANSRAISSADYFGDNSGNGGGGRSNRSSGYNADSMVDYGMGLLGDGFSKLSTAASVAATKITDTSREFTNKVQEKGLINEVQDLAGDGWSLINSYFNKAKETLTADSNDSYGSRGGYGGGGGGYGGGGSGYGGGAGGYNSSGGQQKSYSWEDSRGTDDYSSSSNGNNNNNRDRDYNDNRRGQQPPTRSPTSYRGNSNDSDRDLMGDEDDDSNNRRRAPAASKSRKPQQQQQQQQQPEKLVDDDGWSWDDTPKKKAPASSTNNRNNNTNDDDDNNNSSSNNNNDGDDWVWKEESTSKKAGASASARKATSTTQKKKAVASDDGAWDGWE